MKKRENPSAKPYMVPALERGMRILELLSEHPAGLAMSDMAPLGLPAASLYRMLATLAELGYVVRGEQDRYRLGRKLLTLGYRSIDESSLLENALGPMRDLRDRLGTSMLMITHDLGIVAQTCDDVGVMYAGEIIEQASVYDLFRQPLHPYTQGLINSTIKLGDTRDRLPTIPGTVPPLTNMPEGCRFHPRCPYATDACRTQKPSMVHREEGHMGRCLRYVSQTQPKGGADT